MLLRRRTLLINAAIGLVILSGVGIAAGALGGAAPQEPEPLTTEVRRGSVIGTVAASGEIVSPDAVGVVFEAAGRVADVAVDVGDEVAAGDVIARLDDQVLTEQVTVAEAAHRAAEAARSQLVAGPSSRQRQLLALERDQAAVQLRQAEEAHERAEASADAARAAADRAVDTASNRLDQAEDAWRAVEDRLCDPVTDDTVTTCVQTQDAIAQAEDALATAEHERDQTRLRESQTVAQTQDTLDQAQLTLRIAEARLDVETAGARSGDVAQADAEVARTAAQLAQARRDVQNATLHAPVGGVVAAVNVQVGGTVSTSSGAAVELTDVGARAAVARFSEADATRLAIGQPAVITFDAIPGVAVNAQVSRIDPTPTLTGNLVQYGVELAFDDLPDGIRIGQTITVEVVTGQADDVLYVPATTVTTLGTRSTVLVYDGESTVERDVEIGLRGDQFVEITAGLAEGDVVVLPSTGTGQLPDVFGPGGPSEPSTEPARGN
ncbi:MAG: efflux RND transporter periplasmic adaptor subunit [Nitriliruptoraceae bacterium]